MSKQQRQDHLAREREDIAARIAKFKATQDRFIREREEYAESTLQKGHGRQLGRSSRSAER